MFVFPFMAGSNRFQERLQLAVLAVDMEEAGGTLICKVNQWVKRTLKGAIVGLIFKISLNQNGLDHNQLH